jgi:Fe-S-cluster containining protein
MSDEAAGEREMAGLVADLGARVQAHAEAHPDAPAEDWLYPLMDGWAAGRGGDALAVLDCRAGCVHCCHQGVMVTVLEAHFLADAITASWPADEVAALRGRLETLWADLRDSGIEQLPLPDQLAAYSRVRRPCSLLDGPSGLCRAYEARPIACRREHSADVEVCRRHREDPDAPLASARLPGLEAAWNAARRLIQSWAEAPDAATLYLPLELALGLALEDR